MKAVRIIPTLLILAVFVFSPSYITFAAHTAQPSKAQSYWVGDVFANTEIWGLGYSSSFTSSSHYLLVSNEDDWKAQYLYEFKASILQINHEQRVPPNPHYQDINAGVVEVEQATININMDNFPQIGDNELFTLDCYTRVGIKTKFDGNDGWSVGLHHSYVK